MGVTRNFSGFKDTDTDTFADLGVGDAGQVITTVNGAAVWADAASGVPDVGSNGQVLTVVAGEWASTNIDVALNAMEGASNGYFMVYDPENADGATWGYGPSYGMITTGVTEITTPSLAFSAAYNVEASSTPAISFVQTGSNGQVLAITNAASATPFEFISLGATTTEIGYLSGATSNLQAQINTKMDAAVRDFSYFLTTTNNSTEITLVASTTSPQVFYVNGNSYSVTSNLTCNLANSGAGGLDTGTIAANTFYYLYGVESSGLKLIASTADPVAGVGPASFTTHWQYVGACFVGTGTVFAQSKWVNGCAKYNKQFEEISHTGNDTLTEKAVKFPATAQMGSGLFQSAVYSYSAISGDNVGDVHFLAVAATGGVGYPIIPLLAYNKVYIKNGAANTVAYFNPDGWVEYNKYYK